MDIVKNLKLLQKIKDDDVKFILGELFQYNAYGMLEEQEIKECIDMSKKYWSWPWNYYRYKDTKKEIVDYWDKIKEIERTKGSEGYDEFHKNVEEYYDPEVYKKYSLRMEEIKKELEKLGFTVKLSYSKDPENFSYHKNPDRMYLTVSY